VHRSPAEPARRPERTMGRGRLLLSTVCLILACMLGSSRGALQGGASKSSRHPQGPIVPLHEWNIASLATSGIWLVALVDPGNPSTQDLDTELGILSGLLAEGAGGGAPAHVGRVSTVCSPGVKKMLNVTTTPAILLLRDGQVRKFPGPRHVQAMLDFVATGWNATVTASPSPLARLGAPARYLHAVVSFVRNLMTETFYENNASYHFLGTQAADAALLFAICVTPIVAGVVLLYTVERSFREVDARQVAAAAAGSGDASEGVGQVDPEGVARMRQLHRLLSHPMDDVGVDDEGDEDSSDGHPRADTTQDGPRPVPVWKQAAQAAQDREVKKDK